MSCEETGLLFEPRAGTGTALAGMMLDSGVVAGNGWIVKYKWTSCEEVARVLFERAGQSHASPLSFAVGKHVEQCEHCSTLRDVLENGPHAEALNRGTREIVTEIASTLRPVVLLPPTRMLVLRTAIVFVLIPALIAGFVSTSGLRAMSGDQVLVIVNVIACSEILLSLSLVSLMVPGCRPRLNPLWLLAVSPLAFTVAVITLFPPSPPRFPAEVGLGCLAVGMIVALPAAIGLWLLSRRGAVLNWITTGAVIGVLAGFVGVTGLLLECDILDRTHQTLWHGAVLGICALAGSAGGGLANILRRRQRGTWA